MKPTPNHIAIATAVMSAATFCIQLPCEAKKQEPAPPKRLMKIGGDSVGYASGQAFLRAQELLNNKQFDQAAALLQQVVEREPNSSAVRFKYGFVLVQQGKNSEALEQAKRCTEIAPRFFGGWALLGEASMNLNLDEQAKAAYAKALEIQPTGENAEIVRDNLKAMAAKNQPVEMVEDPVAAEQNRKIMIVNKALALCNQANNDLKQRQFDQGLQRCRDALKLAPESNEVKENCVAYLNNYAADCVQHQNLKPAEALMKEALTIQAKGGVTDKSRMTTLKNYAALLNFLGRTDEAKKIEAQMKTTAPSSAQR